MTDQFQSLLSGFSSFYDGITLHFSRSVSKSVQLNGQKPENTDLSDNLTIYVRAVKNGRMITSAFSGADEKTVENFLKSGMDTVIQLPADDFRVIPKYGFPENGLGLTDGMFRSIGVKELTDIAKEMTSQAFKTDMRVKAVKQSYVSAALKETEVISTMGPALKSAKTVFSAGIYLIASDGRDERDCYESVMSTSLQGLKYITAAVSAADSACDLLGAKNIKTGRYSILFSAGVMADFIDLVLELTDGDNVYKGLSMLAGKLGTKAASENFTLTDDPLIMTGIASRSFDDEGQRCWPLDIFRGGELKNFLHNSYTSKALGVDNNGRAVLTSGGNIAVGATNIELATTSERKPAELADEYLKVTEVMGMHTADPVSGDFSVGISGILYRGGQAVHPFKEAVLAGNLADLLEGLIHVFDNRRTFGNITTADTLFDKMSVSGV